LTEDGILGRCVVTKEVAEFNEERQR